MWGSPQGGGGPARSWPPEGVGSTWLLPSTLKAQSGEHREGCQDRVEAAWAFTRKTSNSSGRSSPHGSFLIGFNYFPFNCIF